MAATTIKRSLPHLTAAVQTSSIRLPPASRLSSFLNRAPTIPSSCLIPHATRSFSTTHTMAESKTFIEAVKARRSIYPLSNESTIPDDRIVELVNSAVLHAPSSFNSQSTRCVVLLKKEHEKLWDITTEILKSILSEDQFVSTSKRMAMFRAAYGTVLFFEDPEPVKELQSKFPLYAEKFPGWSEHASAIHQFIIWTALEAEGLGANLQHYNPLIDQRVSNEWGVPAEWKLVAQLVFGKPAGPAGDKTFKPLEERVFVHGK